MKELNYKIGIRKVLSQLHPDAQITKAALLLVNNMLIHLTVKLIKASNNISNLAKKKLLSIADITAAVKIVLGDELANYSIAEGNKAVLKYKNSRNVKKNFAKEKYAGLQFKISATYALVQKNINKGSSVFEDAVVFLTAAIEQIAAELLDLSGNVVTGNKRIQMTPRDVFLAVRNDDELNKIFRGFMLGTGVVPNIDHKLKGGAPNRKIAKDNILGITKPGLQRLMRKAGVKYISGLIYEESRSILMRFIEKIVHNSIIIAERKSHTTIMYEDGIEALNLLNISVYSAKGYPGTMAPCKGSHKISKLFPNQTNDTTRRHRPKTNLLRIIQKYQKTSCTLLPHVSVERLIREIGQEYSKTITRYEINYMWLIHATIEDYMVKLYQNAMLLALHCDRLTLMPKDIHLARKIQDL